MEPPVIKIGKCQGSPQEVVDCLSEFATPAALVIGVLVTVCALALRVKILVEQLQTSRRKNHNIQESLLAEGDTAVTEDGETMMMSEVGRNHVSTYLYPDASRLLFSTKRVHPILSELVGTDLLQLPEWKVAIHGYNRWLRWMYIEGLICLTVALSTVLTISRTSSLAVAINVLYASALSVLGLEIGMGVTYLLTMRFRFARAAREVASWPSKYEWAKQLQFCLEYEISFGMYVPTWVVRIKVIKEIDVSSNNNNDDEEDGSSNIDWMTPLVVQYPFFSQDWDHVPCWRGFRHLSLANWRKIVFAVHGARAISKATLCSSQVLKMTLLRLEETMQHLHLPVSGELIDFGSTRYFFCLKKRPFTGVFFADNGYPAEKKENALKGLHVKDYKGFGYRRRRQDQGVRTVTRPGIISIIKTCPVGDKTAEIQCQYLMDGYWLCGCISALLLSGCSSWFFTGGALFLVSIASVATIVALMVDQRGGKNGRLEQVGSFSILSALCPCISCYFVYFSHLPSALGETSLYYTALVFAIVAACIGFRAVYFQLKIANLRANPPLT